MNAKTLKDYVKQSIEGNCDITPQGLKDFENTNPKYIKHKLGFYWDGWETDQQPLNDKMLAEYKEKVAEYEKDTIV